MGVFMLCQYSKDLADLFEDGVDAVFFHNPADIGGRYSALSLFGLVSGALLGIPPSLLLTDTLPLPSLVAVVVVVVVLLVADAALALAAASSLSPIDTETE